MIDLMTRMFTVLMLVAMTAGSSMAQTGEEAFSPEGTWRSYRPPEAEFELVLTLTMEADGTAVLLTEAAGGAAFPEKGTWRRDKGKITVLVFEENAPPSPNELILEPRGDDLAVLQWASEFYGSATLGPFQRQAAPDEGPQ